MSLPIRPLAFFLIFSLGTAFAQKPAEENADDPGPAAEKFPPTEKIVYKTVGDVSLRLHIFLPPGHRKDAKTPAIVFFFGGAFRSGKPIQFYGQSHYLASRGMVAIAAEYRIKNVHGTEPTTCVQDAKSALRWVRSHAAELGINPHRIAAGGGSAGGFLAAATATLPGRDEPGEDTTISCRPDALVIFNGSFDARPDGSGFEKALLAQGADFLPINHIAAPFPPTIFLVGSKDHIIPPEGARNIQAVIEKTGGRCDLFIYENESHGFFNLNRSGGKYFKMTLTEVDKFFTSLGWLQGKPATP